MRRSIKCFWSVIIVCGMVFFTACEPDSLEEDLPKSGTSAIVKKLTREELQTRFSVMEKLEEIESGFRKRTIDSGYDFTVETDEIVYIEKGNQHSYTFLITTDKADSGLETLVLDYKDGTYRTYRIMYDTTSDFVVKKVRYRKSDSEIVWEELADYRYHSKEWQDDLGLNLEDYRALLSELEKKKQSNIDLPAETMRKISFSNLEFDDLLHLHSTGQSGAMAGDFDTDLYNTGGKKIGTDGVDSGIKMVVVDKNEVRQILKMKGNVDLNNVKSGVTLPSDITLQESLNVLDRTIANGELREESSIVMNDGTIIKGQTGSMPTIVHGVQTATISLPNLPAGTIPADVEATIHSHPTKVQQLDNMMYPQEATVPSGTDRGTFSQFNRNIIVGSIGTVNLNNLTKNPDGTLNIPSRPNGAVIYDRNTDEILKLERNAIESILKK